MINERSDAFELSASRGRTHTRPRILSFVEGAEPYHLPLLVLVALLARIAFIFDGEPIILGWRPADMAGIALNYFRNGFHLFYPQVSWGGNGPGYVETEFPIIPFLTAVLYRIFGVHEWVALILPMLSGLGLVAVVYFFARRMFGNLGGLVAGLFTAVSPTLCELTTSLWPDPPMVFCGALGIYALTRWVEEDTWGYFLLGALSASLAILLKLTALYIGIPILYICIMKYRTAVWKSAMVWLLGALILLPVVAWYWHSHMLYLEYHNTFGILSGGYSKFATAGILLDPVFYGRAVMRILIYHLTAFAFVLFVYGMIAPGGAPRRHVLHVWVGSVALYMLVAARGVVVGHYQYLLPIVPPALILAGGGTAALIRKIEQLARGSSVSPWAYSLLATLCTAGVVVGTVLFLDRDKYSTPGWENDRNTGLAVGRVTAPGSLIVVVDTQMDDLTPERSMTPPQVFYFGDRHGWYESLAWLNEGLVEQLRNSGARYLAVTANAIPAFTSSPSPAAAYMRAHFNTVLNSEEGIVYDLTDLKP